MRVPGIRLPSWTRPAGLSGWQRVAVVVGLAVVLLATMSVAATARVGASSGRILAGVTVAGVDVGGLTRAEAVAAVKATTEPKLRRNVPVAENNAKVAKFVRGLAPKLAVEPTDAAIRLVDGQVVRQKARDGRVLDVKASTRRLAR